MGDQDPQVLRGQRADRFPPKPVNRRHQTGCIGRRVAPRIALDLLKQHTEAQALYRKALAASPDDPIVISNLGLSLALSGQKEEAAKVMSALRGQELMPRIRNNYDVVRAANGDITGGNEQTFRLAKAMDTKG